MIKNEMVNHPQHYKNNTFECIDIMLDIFGKDKTAAFCELNAFKYLWRANNKGTDIQDKKKAIWYLNKYIELKENNNEYLFKYLFSKKGEFKRLSFVIYVF